MKYIPVGIKCQCQHIICRPCGRSKMLKGLFSRHSIFGVADAAAACISSENAEFAVCNNVVELFSCQRILSLYPPEKLLFTFTIN